VIAVDTSTVIAYLGGQPGPDVDCFDAALAGSNAALPPAAVSELLSDNKLPAMQREMILGLPMLELTPDYWLRVGAMRALLLSRKLRARLADALIAQACIDNDVVLITRDGDFRHFAKHCGLKLA
jgi:predicted nucleic acid-binding protein